MWYILGIALSGTAIKILWTQSLLDNEPALKNTPRHRGIFLCTTI